MKIKMFAFMALSGLLMASCSNEMDQTTDSLNQSNQIKFSTYSAMSKGAPINGNNDFAKAGSSFFVKGYINEASSDKYYLSADIDHDGSSWNYRNSADVVYWPSSPMNFHAVTKSSSLNNISTTYNSISFEHEVPTTTSSQNDVMVAQAINVSKKGNGKVNLKFRHIFNQIHFKGKTSSKNLKVIINPNAGIELGNLYSAGTCSVTTTTTGVESEGGAITWSAQGKNNKKPVYRNISPTGDLTINNNTVNLTKEEDVLMLIPQPSELEAWDPKTSSNTTVTEQNGSYLKISCKLIALGEGGAELSYLHGTADSFEFMYVPFDCTAMKNVDATSPTGKKITYTLIFGGGYTEGGQPILTPITFETNVQNWDDQPSNGGDINTNN